MSNLTNPAHAIPCYRCGAPVASDVAGLLAALADGSVSATKAYYVHGTSEGPTCGHVIQPGGSSDRAVYGPFREAVKAAMNGALKAQGYVRVLHCPSPVKAGGEEEAKARAASAAIQARMNDAASRSKVPATALAAGCMFYRDGSGAWRMGPEPVTVPAPVAPVAPVGAPPVAPPPAPPAPPVAPVAGPMAPPPPPPAPRVHVALTDGTVAHVTIPDARAMMADGRAYSVCINGAWGATLP